MLDQYIQRLQNMEPFWIYAIDSNGEVKPWYEVTGVIVNDLVLKEESVGVQVQAIGGQIGHWGRMVAQCKRVWEIEERKYRIWRSRTWLDIITAPREGVEDKPGWSKTAKGEHKAPTKEQSEAIYRCDPAYVEYQTAIERAEEAYNASEAILNAFKAKREMIRAAVWRDRETGKAELIV